MLEKKVSSLASATGARNPFTLLHQMATELDRVFDDWPSWRLPSWETGAMPAGIAWSPKIDLFERDDRLVARVDLPGMKKEDVSVSVTDGRLALSGERKRETEEKADAFYRIEREYGSFYRVLPLPRGVKPGDVKATFADGVLEVSVPLPDRPESQVTRVRIEEPNDPAKSAA